MTHPFITHNGGPCPVSPEAVVDVEFADGVRNHGHRAKFWLWDWDRPRANRIIAYRLHQPATTQPTEV